MFLFFKRFYITIFTPSRVYAAMAHTQVLYQLDSAPAKMKLNILKVDHIPGTYYVETGLG